MLRLSECAKLLAKAAYGVHGLTHGNFVVMCALREMRLYMRPRKLAYQILIVGVALLSLLMISAAVWLLREPSPSSGAISAGTRTTAESLYEAFSSNELQALAAFGGPPLTVTGIVGTVDLTPTNDVSITLVSSSNDVLATAVMRQEAWQDTARLMHGQAIAVRCGTVMFGDSSVRLNDCILAHDEAELPSKP